MGSTIGRTAVSGIARLSASGGSVSLRPLLAGTAWIRTLIVVLAAYGCQVAAPGGAGFLSVAKCCIFTTFCKKINLGLVGLLCFS